MHPAGYALSMVLRQRHHAATDLLWLLQGLLQKAQQIVTLGILDNAMDAKLHTALKFMQILFKVNLKARLLPIGEFYNDAGLFLIEQD